MARRRKKTLPKTKQKRGCANVLVDRDDVLEGGKVPKGCRFVRGGDVMCTPAVAEKVDAIRVVRTKPVKSRVAKKAAKKSSSRKGEAKHCYSENSRLPYLKKRSKTGKKVLKKGCRKDRKTGKICCDRRQSRRRAKSATVDGLDLADFRLPAMDGLPTPEQLEEALRDGTLGDTLDPRALEAMGRQTLAEAGPSLALLDDGDLELPDHSELAMLDDADELGLGPPGAALEPRAAKEPLASFGEFAAVWAGGTVIAGAGLWGTYYAVDNWDYLDDKPMGRAATLIGVGAAGAGLAWFFADGTKYATQIRTLAAGFGITLSAVGVLGLARAYADQRASDTEDPNDRKAAEDWADNIPWWSWSPPDATDETGGDDGETVTDGSEGGTSSPYPMPGATRRDRRGRHRR